MMDELTKARFKEAGDALQTVAKFANGLADEIAVLRDDVRLIKSWARTMLAKEIEHAAAELRVEIGGVLAESHETARSRAKAAEDELLSIEKVLTNGPSKSVRLVHDSTGKAIGAVISDVKN